MKVNNTKYLKYPGIYIIKNIKKNFLPDKVLFQINKDITNNSLYLKEKDNLRSRENLLFLLIKKVN